MKNVLQVASRLLAAGRSKDRIETDIARTWGLSSDQRKSLRDHLEKVTNDIDAKKFKQAI